jgi:hypothetical protein
MFTPEETTLDRARVAACDLGVARRLATLIAAAIQLAKVRAAQINLLGHSTLVATVAATLLAATSAIQAQTNQTPVDGAMPPLREGDIYDHKDHQPTEAEISRARAAAGDRAQSTNPERVEKGVTDLLKQMDKLEIQSEQELELH